MATIFKLKISKDARRDLRKLYDYIAENFLAPETAEAQAARIVNAIRSLVQFPLRYKLCDDDLLRKENIRLFHVNKYNVFYTVHEESAIVEILRIAHGSMNISRLFMINN